MDQWDDINYFVYRNRSFLPRLMKFQSKRTIHRLKMYSIKGNGITSFYFIKTLFNALLYCIKWLALVIRRRFSTSAISMDIRSITFFKLTFVLQLPISLYFYTPENRQKTLRFSDVFWGCRNVILGKNGLIRHSSDPWMFNEIHKNQFLIILVTTLQLLLQLLKHWYIYVFLSRCHIKSKMFFLLITFFFSFFQLWRWYIHVFLPRSHIKSKMFFLLIFFFSFFQTLHWYTHGLLPRCHIKRLFIIFISFFFFFQPLHWYIHIFLPRCHIKSNFFLYLFFLQLFSTFTAGSRK